MNPMTRSSVTPAAPDLDRSRRSGLAAGIAALVASGTFVFGIAMFATSLGDYTTDDPTPAESVDFLVGHQGSLFAWYLVIFVVFGIALVPLTLGLRQRLRHAEPGLADAAAAFGLIWVGLMFATGMISNIGIEVVADLAGDDPTQAAAVWSSIDAITNGLGGGNELVGALWILLVSAASLRSASLPRGLDVVGVVTAVAGLATLAPGFEAVEMVFGLGSIVWFTWLGVVLTRGRADRSDRSARSDHAAGAVAGPWGAIR